MDAISLVVFLAVFGIFAVAGLTRPVYGFALYVFTYLVTPVIVNVWGTPIPGSRWNLAAGTVFLLALVVNGRLRSDVIAGPPRSSKRWTFVLLAAIVINATLVHLLLADDTTLSSPNYVARLKSVLLCLMLFAAIRNESDFKIAVWSIILCAGFVGWMTTIYGDALVTRHGRVEGFGIADMAGSNELARFMGVGLCLCGLLLLISGSWKRQLAVVALIAGIMNTVILCNSRAGFLALLLGVPIFLAATPRVARGRALKLVGLAAMAAWLLLGNPKIIKRFMTTFHSSEERDDSTQFRITLAMAGREMIRDYPLGEGGDAFKYVHGLKYLRDQGYQGDRERTLHNGYLTECCEWGVQGLFLLLSVLALASLAAYRVGAAMRNDTMLPLTGACIVMAVCVFAMNTWFGEGFKGELAFWLVAIGLTYADVYAWRACGSTDEAVPEFAHHFSGGMSDASLAWHGRPIQSLV